MRERLGRAVKGNAWPLIYLGRVRVKVLAKNPQAPKLARLATAALLRTRLAASAQRRLFKPESERPLSTRSGRSAKGADQWARSPRSNGGPERGRSQATGGKGEAGLRRPSLHVLLGASLRGSPPVSADHVKRRSAAVHHRKFETRSWISLYDEEVRSK